MDSKTVQYKRTLRGSVGAGVGALFNGNGRRYYILEHKSASKYHRAGESQKIIIDQAEMGRDAKCQVRFDGETFPTVSRRHAAIVKNGEGWKIVHLSTTNSTLVNGQRVETERPLQNGDEIQLSVGGPRMGFIVPAGKQGLTSSLRLTERLNLFRRQALRPYKTAIACLAVLLLIACGAGGVFSWQQNKHLAKHDNQIDSLYANSEAQKEVNASITANYEKNRKEIAALRNRKSVNITRYVSVDGSVSKLIDGVKSSVYAVITTVYLQTEQGTQKAAISQGTGFLMTDGTFVTARHCVEPWLYNMELNKYYALTLRSNAYKMYATIAAYNNKGDALQIRSDKFTVDNSYDNPITQTITIGDESYELPSKLGFGTEASLGNDWAYCKVGKSGNIKNGKAYSASLKSGTTAHVLGFPQGTGIGDGKTVVDPIYNKLSIARDGLTKARCIMVNQGIDHGNSGGPVFIEKNGQLYVIGIVSRGDFNSKFYNHLIPMSNI